MEKVDPPDRVAAEIHSPAFVEALPRYIAHATFLLREKGMGEGAHHAPGVQWGDVINGAVDDCLAGERKWKEGIPFSTFFRDAIRSEVYHRCHRARQHQGECIEEVGELAAPSSRRIEKMDARAELDAVRGALVGDPRTKAMFGAFEDGAEKRADVAERLGWDPDEVSRVRDVARRRLAAAGVHQEKDKKVG